MTLLDGSVHKHGSFYWSIYNTQDNKASNTNIRQHIQDFLFFIQAPLLSLFHPIQCFLVTWEMWMVCASETLLWMSSISLSYGSSTPTHLEQTNTLQKSEVSQNAGRQHKIKLLYFYISNLDTDQIQPNKYVLNADKRWRRSCKHYPKSEYSTCLKILHPRLNIQNTLN